MDYGIYDVNDLMNEPSSIPRIPGTSTMHAIIIVDARAVLMEVTNPLESKIKDLIHVASYIWFCR